MGIYGGADFDYREWLVSIEITCAGEALSGHADLFWEGQQKCRVVLSSLRLNEAETRLALGTKARAFIDDWMSREHTGDTAFSKL